MSLRIKDRLELSLFFDGLEFPLDQDNVLNFVHASASTRIGLPMLHLSVQDSLQWFTRKATLADGMLIELVIKVGDDRQTFAFRLNQFREDRSATGVTYEIDGYLDKPLYWLRSLNTAIRGSSFDVLKTIATDSGLTFRGDRTADSQLWLPQGKRAYAFVRHVVSHGYKDTRSCMQSAVTMLGGLRYLDVSSNARVSGKFLASKYQKDSFMASDYRPKSFSGLMNSFSGYASESIQPSILTDDATKLENVTVTKRNVQLAMNSRLHKAIDRSAVHFRPIDCGNVHPKYEEAFYQNVRLSNLFSVGLDLVTPDVTDLDVLDWVLFEANTLNNSQPNKALSGAYLIASKALYIQGINYFEKFELLRTGIDTQVEGQV